MPTCEGHQCRAVPRFNLGDVLFVIFVLSLVFSIFARAVRSGRDLEWLAVGLAFALFAMLLCPILLICAVIRFSPTSLPAERAAVGLVFKTLVVIMLLGMSLVINSL
jgi:hypothetical protein